MIVYRITKFKRAPKYKYHKTKQKKEIGLMGWFRNTKNSSSIIITKLEHNRKNAGKIKTKKIMMMIIPRCK